MAVFKKGLNFKVISITVIVAFLLTNNAYPEILCKNSLRKYLDFKQGEDNIARYKGLYNIISEFDKSIYSTATDNPDRSTRLERNLLFLAEKISPAMFPLFLSFLFSSMLIEDLRYIIPFIISFLLIGSPIVLKWAFQVIMLLPIRPPLIEPGFYGKEYYDKTSEDRAKFILEQLKTKAKERDDNEALKVLDMVKGFKFIKMWPATGEVFDLPTGKLFITPGMTEQPLQMQYMIMRRGREMWYFNQVRNRKKPVYRREVDRDVGRFLVLHSKYIGIFLIYELCVILDDRSVKGALEFLTGRKMVLKKAVTIDAAMETVKEKMAKGHRYTPIEFANEFNFSEGLSKLLLKTANIVKEEKKVDTTDSSSAKQQPESLDKNRYVDLNSSL